MAIFSMIEKDNSKWTTWQANVQDRFKGLPVEDIKNHLIAASLPLAATMINHEKDYNFGTFVRNANGFNLREVFYLSTNKRYDKRSACGVYNYTDVTFLPSINDLIKLKEKYPMFIAVENCNRSTCIKSFVWPREPTMLLFGSESIGLSDEMLDLCNHVISIPMPGSVRSFNVGVASGVIFYDYSLKIGARNVAN